MLRTAALQCRAHAASVRRSPGASSSIRGTQPCTPRAPLPASAHHICAVLAAPRSPSSCCAPRHTIYWHPAPPLATTHPLTGLDMPVTHDQQRWTLRAAHKTTPAHIGTPQCLAQKLRPGRPFAVRADPNTEHARGRVRTSARPSRKQAGRTPLPAARSPPIARQPCGRLGGGGCCSRHVFSLPGAGSAGA